MGPGWYFGGELAVPCHHYLFISCHYSHFQGNQIVFLLVSEEKEKSHPGFQSNQDLRKVTKDIMLNVSHTNVPQSNVSLVFCV